MSAGTVTEKKARRTTAERRRRFSRRSFDVVRTALRSCMEHARVPRIRTMLEFAEQEVVLPDGPYRDLPYRADRQPFNRLWFREVDRVLSARMRGDDSYPIQRFAVVGPSQSSKTVIGCLIPLMYHLFEVRENVIFGLPDMQMASDKWMKDLRPIIAASRYAECLPDSGKGSKGSGAVEAVYFRNGTILKFMSGGGSDKRRAGFTAGVLLVSEVDALDDSSTASAEADRLTQMEARLRAFGSRAIEYLECTVTTELGRIWREYSAGTKSRLGLRCPHCGAAVTPERAHFRGWENADSELAARRLTAVYCPKCGQAWSEEDRRSANGHAILIHDGQDTNDLGAVVGNPRETRTLGFRWSAVNNLFLAVADIGADLWRSSRDPDQDNAERFICQFVFAEPYKPPSLDATTIRWEQVACRRSNWPRGTIPDLAETVICGVDVGKWWLHWVAVAFLGDGSPHVVDYGALDIPSRELGAEGAILEGLRELREKRFRAAWSVEGGGTCHLDRVLIDAHYKDHVVYQFCAESAQPDDPTGGLILPVMGFGSSQMSKQRYSAPRGTSSRVLHIGDHYHIAYLDDRGVIVVQVDADHWKSYAHERALTATGQAGAMTLFDATASEHAQFARHLAAEHQVEDFQPGKPPRLVWVRQYKQNHWFDALYYALVGGHLHGCSVVRAIQRPTDDEMVEQPVLTMPDGRPFMPTER